MAGTLIGQGVMFAALMYLTQIYSPHSFGVFGTFQSLIGTIWVITTMRYDLAIPISKDNNEKTILSTLSFLLSFCFCLLSVFLLFFNSTITKIELWASTPIQYLTVFGTFLIATYFTFEYYAVSHKQFTTISLSKMFQVIGVSVVQLGLGFIYPNEFSLIIGYLCGFVISIIILSRNKVNNNKIINIDKTKFSKIV